MWVTGGRVLILSWIMRRWCAVQKTFCLSEMRGRERREVKVMAGSE